MIATKGLEEAFGAASAGGMDAGIHDIMIRAIRPVSPRRGVPSGAADHIVVEIPRTGFHG
jgi:hypothetical protein